MWRRGIGVCNGEVGGLGSVMGRGVGTGVCNRGGGGGVVCFMVTPPEPLSLQWPCLIVCVYPVVVLGWRK